jgi:hypothetical protein
MMTGLPVAISIIILIVQYAFLVFLRGGFVVSSPRTPFNSFRALSHLKFVSRDSCEIGSSHYRATFSYIVKSLLESGLEVCHQARNSTFLTRAWISQREETIWNTIGMRAGSDPSLNSLIPSAYFDSHTNTAGPEDVAVILELAHSARSRANFSSSSLVLSTASVMGHFIRNFYSAPGCSSTTDLYMYSAVGLSGVELVHIGNPKKRHTALDRGPLSWT